MDEHRHRFRGSFTRAAQSAVPGQPAAVPHQAQHQSKPKKTGFFFGRKWLLVVIVLLIAGLGFLTYGYIHTKNQLNAAKNPETAGKTEIQQIQNHIGATVSLPNETPTLATVSDAAKLKTQIFFKDAQNGDKVLIFPHAGTAILYRPSTKKVIEYAPVNLGNSQ